MKDNDTKLSHCHKAPVVICEGAAWDVPLESIRKGSTYFYGCSLCHKACDIYTGSDTKNPSEKGSLGSVSIPAKADIDSIPLEKEIDEILNHHLQDIRAGHDNSLKAKLLALIAERERTVMRAASIGAIEKVQRKMRPMILLDEQGGNNYAMYWDERDQVWNRARYKDLIREAKKQLKGEDI